MLTEFSPREFDLTKWQLEGNREAPDFIICGAMKSGTSSIHKMLNLHPQVFIPDQELHYFDLDNILQHPDFNKFSRNQWCAVAHGQNFERYKSWYLQQFNNAGPGQLKGEDSTTYLASHNAFSRISRQAKNIKLVVVLRNPTVRAISNYWHLLRSGRAIYNIEDTLMYMPHSIVERSLYCQQIKLMLEFIPKERIKFVVFEKFLADKESVLAEICEFLSIDATKLPDDTYAVHANKSFYPKFMRLQLLKNRLLKRQPSEPYLSRYLEQSEEHAVSGNFKLGKLIEKLHRMVNPLVTKKPVTINANTIKFLEDYFSAELIGIDELIGQQVYDMWFPNSTKNEN
ncbi:sulfotransferase family protein [Thalassotalea fusca]